MSNQDIQQQMQDLLDEIRSSKPKAETFVNADGTPDTIGFQTAVTSWVQDYQAQAKIVSDLTNHDLGVATLPDGTMVPISNLSPEEQAYVEKYNTQVYNQALAKYGLDEFSLRRQAVQDENARLADEFQAKRQVLSDKMGLESHSLDQALGELDRWTKGQQVAGEDATRIQNAQQEASKWGTTDGKTSFTGADLGAGMDLLAQQGGVPSGTPLIKYPGVQSWDPVGDRQASLAGMGISEQAPQIPQSVLSFNDIPGVPQFGSVGQSPSGQAPMLPPSILPSWQPGVAANTNAPGSRIGSMGNGLEEGMPGYVPPTSGPTTPNWLTTIINGVRNAPGQVAGAGGPLSLGIR